MVFLANIFIHIIRKRQAVKGLNLQSGNCFSTERLKRRLAPPRSTETSKKEDPQVVVYGLHDMAEGFCW